MTVCGHRTDTPGMFTTCSRALAGTGTGCICSRQVLEEYVDGQSEAEAAAAIAHRPMQTTSPAPTTETQEAS